VFTPQVLFCDGDEAAVTLGAASVNVIRNREGALRYSVWAGDDLVVDEVPFHGAVYALSVDLGFRPHEAQAAVLLAEQVADESVLGAP